MQKEEIVELTVRFVKDSLKEAESGHDWWHILRVWNTAKAIALEEQVDGLIVELASLLHDIADPKFHNGDEEIGPETAKKFMQSIGLQQDIAFHVEQIIRNMSFKSSLGKLTFHSKELEVVQDADRLDAIGAIGIARAFTYGGYKNRELFNPQIPPNLNMSKEDYKKNTAPTINHFYEKLLLLKDKMNTAAGKRLAEKRHLFMEDFLNQFYAEWNGEK
ncbi:HD domain-containing protein [Pararcticibacter amylolyticus]|uniref:Phosphohydrolase n=1 Tax=Pararcticibacter amylolyticus TaxID=2173175 RepID=A0A2U2PML6_9SPHI|nr:HD domain-containing protein [Pararcticibacter amylolyticus]PWG82544.1 phosphohydrolase [Pararcticibacter amylolyticus]